MMFGLTASAFSQEIFRSETRLPDGTVLIYGKWKKPAIGPIDIPFNYSFKDVNSIVVVVSPNYRSGVGGIETISSVQSDRFQVTSGNAAPEYFVSWMATGK